VALVLISFVFCKLDQRVRYLIKRAEGALKTLEEDWKNRDPNTDGHQALFSAEEADTKELRTQLREKYPSRPWLWHMTYYECFCLVYVVFGVIGMLGAILSIVGLLN